MNNNTTFGNKERKCLPFENSDDKIRRKSMNPQLKPKETTNDNLTEWVNKIFFSRGGDYDELTKLDVSGVRQASLRAIIEIEKWVKQFSVPNSLNYLDLACGTNIPFVSNGIFSFLQAYYPHVAISYEGIDINKDITKVGRFPFPENVISQNLLWGNAFELKNRQPAISENTYDIIYFGLILHHATAQEIVSLGRFLSSILKKMESY